MKYLLMFLMVAFILGCGYRVDSDIYIEKDEYRFPKVEYYITLSVWIYKGRQPIAPVHSSIKFCQPNELDSVKKIVDLENKYWVAVGDSLIKIKEQQ